MASLNLLLVLAVLIILDLLFSATRTSLTEARLPYLIGSRSHKPEDLERTISLLGVSRLSATLRASIVVVHFLMALVVWKLITTAYPDADSLLWAGLLLMFVLALIVLSIEFLVEGLVRRDTETWAVRFTGLGKFIDAIFSPVAWVLRGFQSSTTQDHALAGVTEDELKTWVEVGGNSDNSLEQGEREMIYSIFHFSDTLCREIMVPRIDVLAVEADIELAEAARLMVESGHSRVPVYDDVIDNLLGMLYAKDILKVNLQEDSTSIRELLRPAYFVPEAKKVDELLKEMQARGVHIAIVVDEYGGMAGLVTLEDIVEEIVGEIRDEYDQSEEIPYQQINDDEFVLTGRLDLDDVNSLLNISLSNDTADTLGGFIYGSIGKVPAEGEQVTVDGWTLTVEQVNGRRIRKVRATRHQPEPLKEILDATD